MRSCSLSRKTNETEVEVSLVLEGRGVRAISTPIPFFDHMLDQVARFSNVDMEVKATGDIDVDGHHIVEDTGIVLGSCLSDALGDRKGIERFSQAAVPMDEALVVVTLDLSGRPYLHYEDAALRGHVPLGSPSFDPQLAEEFFRALCVGAKLTLHVDYVRGKNTHHMLEAAFKAFGRALGKAICITGAEVPSTKGVI